MAFGTTPHRPRALRRRSTEAEQKLWAFLRRRQLDGAHFRRQEPIGAFIVDFVCRPARLVIEIDGGQHALHVARDSRRTAALEALGFREIRFWNNEVLANTDGVVAVIRTELQFALQGPPPDPPPLRGRGAK